MVLDILLGQGNPVLQVIISFVTFAIFIFGFQWIMVNMILSKLKRALVKFQGYAGEAEEIFMGAFKKSEHKKITKFLHRMKEMVIVPPTSLDPSGIMDKLEHILDTAEWKIVKFIDTVAPKKDAEERANLFMAYGGVHGTHQMYLVIRHLLKLTEKTKNFQLGAMMQMFMPLYDELARSQKAMTTAFVKGLPIGDAVGPMIAAKLMTKKTQEVAHNIVVTKEKIGKKNIVVMKAKGPGARLGKYGEAVREVVKKHKIKKIYTIDAGLRYEGEDTGKVAEGIGVLMGGPGVDKSKIEEIATEHKLPLEGIVIKMNAFEASAAMNKKIYSASGEAHARLIENIKDDPETNILVIGVGNTGGVANNQKDIEEILRKLRKIWKEQEEKDEGSAMGLMGAFPGTGGRFSHITFFGPKRHQVF